MGQGHPGGMAQVRGPQRPNMVRGQGLPNPAFLPMPPGLPMPGMMGPMMGMGPSASSQRGGHQVVITSLLLPRSSRPREQTQAVSVVSKQTVRVHLKGNLSMQYDA